MKLLIFILFFCFTTTQPQASGQAIKTYPMEWSVEKNEINTFKIPYSGNNRVIIEITKKPKHIKVLPHSEKISIICLTDGEFVGEDIFYFRIYDGEVMSNISKCTVTVGKKQADNKSAKQQITERMYRSRRV